MVVIGKNNLIDACAGQARHLNCFWFLATHSVNRCLVHQFLCKATINLGACMTVFTFQSAVIADVHAKPSQAIIVFGFDEVIVFQCLVCNIDDRHFDLPIVQNLNHLYKYSASYLYCLLQLFIQLACWTGLLNILDGRSHSLSFEKIYLDLDSHSKCNFL